MAKKTKSIDEKIKDQERKIQASKKYAANRKVEIKNLKIKQQQQIISQIKEILGVKKPSEIVDSLKEHLQVDPSNKQNSGQSNPSVNNTSSDDEEEDITKEIPMSVIKSDKQLTAEYKREQKAKKNANKK